MRLQQAYEKYQGKADFWWIYIREAHPVGSRRPATHVSIEQPTNQSERDEVAATCSSALKLKVPQLVDDMNDTVSLAYSAWPDRLFILDAKGTIVYAGGPGPWGFSVPEMEAALEAQLKRAQ